MADKLRVLLVPYNEEPRVVEIEHKLEEMQRLVGGLIEAIHVKHDEGTNHSGVDVWCNEEGLFQYHDQPNRMVFHAGGPAVYIHGPFFVARVDEEGDTLSLTDADIKRYSQLYRL